MTVATLGDAAAPGRRKVAVALVALGPARAAVLLRGMAEDEVTAIAGEIAQLGPVTPAEVTTAGLLRAAAPLFARPPAALEPLYLRRPDAVPPAARKAVSR